MGTDPPRPPEGEDAEWLRRLLSATDRLLHQLEAMVERGDRRIGEPAFRRLTVLAAFLPEPWPVQVTAETLPHLAIEELFAIQDVLLTARVVKPADMVEFDEGWTAAEADAPRSVRLLGREGCRQCAISSVHDFGRHELRLS